MATTSRWSAKKFLLRLEIGSFVFEDVIQFTATFAKNTIPTATISIPVGRHAQSNLAAEIHNHFDGVVTRLPAKVYITVTDLGKNQLTYNIPSGLLFDGYFVGMGWRKSRDGAQFTIGLQHWLADLHYASSLSASSHPGNPADLTYSSVAKYANLGMAGAGTSGLPNWVPMAAGFNAITPGMITENLWEKVLKPWLLQLASRDPIDKQLSQDVKSDQTATLAAINKMVGVNMGMKLGTTDDGLIADGVRAALGQESWDNWVNNTLWGKVIGDWMPSYFFDVIPRISDALVVPCCPGLRGTYATITAADYHYAEISSQITQLLGSVGIIHPTRDDCGANNNHSETQGKRSGLAGNYPKPPRGNGIKMTKAAPSWLQTTVQNSRYSNVTTGSQNKTISTNFGPPVAKDTKLAAPTQNLGSVRLPLMDQYAHQWYVIEALKGRTGEISGKYRTDIAPGSSVKIECSSERFLKDDSLGENLYGNVLSLTSSINSEAQTAGTSFSIGNVRNEVENEDPDLAIDSPPLYTAPWLGDVLM